MDEKGAGTLMNVEQMKIVLREILTKTDLTPCVVGHRGVGKTAGVVQVCREIGYRYVPLRLGQMEVGDLVDIPFREGDTMRWSRPSWWPAGDSEPTLVHCDELNRAQQEDCLQAIFQFVEPPAEGQSRALHTHQLDARHKVVVTINPSDGSYQMVPPDRALVDRMVLLFVETDYDCWAKYARARQLDAEVQQFLGGNPRMLSTETAAMDVPRGPSERGWEMVSRLRSSCRFPAELELEVYAGVIGREAAVSFLRWCRSSEARPLSAVQILDDWEAVAAQAAVQRDDVQAATMSELLLCLEGDEELPLTREKNLVAYIAVLPRELRFGFVKSLVKIPEIAHALCQECYNEVIFDAIRHISEEA